MESIDALAKAVNEFEGGIVLVSHDMRLISQVAEEIWICDNKRIEKYKGDIQSFKMDMRADMGIEGEQKGQLRGDASVMKTDDSTKDKKKKEKKSISVEPVKEEEDTWGDDAKKEGPLDNIEAVKESLPTPAPAPAKGSYVPPHLRNKDGNGSGSAPGGRYIPPHLRNK